MAPPHASAGRWAAVALVPSRRARPQAGAAASRTVHRSLIQHCLEGDLFIALTPGQYHGDRPPVAFGAQVQLGRETALAAAKRLPCRDFLGRRPVAARTASMLMRTNDGGIHEVQVPVDLAALFRLGLQVREDALPDPGLAPTVEPARHRAHRPVAPRQVTPRRTGAMDP